MSVNAKIQHINVFWKVWTQFGDYYGVEIKLTPIGFHAISQNSINIVY